MKHTQPDIKILHQKGLNPLIQFTQRRKTKLLSTGRICYYPIGKWKNVEKNIEVYSTNDFIGFFQVNKDTYNSFRYNELPKFDSFSQHNLIEIANQLLKSIDSLDILLVRSLEVIINPSRKNSTAYNPNIKEYLGLHIDSHDGISNKDRGKAWHLVNINMGNKVRYLHFIDLTFKNIIEILGIENSVDIKENKISMSKIVQLFFELFPEYPIKRIVLPPAHGYIARTQNFIHDGGTNWNGEKDISVLISGDFKVTF
ncbi:MAG: hypothetical protein WCK82_09070 [Bacteroidota bacterium]